MSYKKVTFILYKSVDEFISFITRYNEPFISLDLETRTIYTKREREEAKNVIKENNVDSSILPYAKLVANSNGLSHPDLIKVTHFILGTGTTHSNLYVCKDLTQEKAIFEAISKASTTFIVHNSLFDLKIMYNRIKKLPKSFVDTSVVVKTLINDSNVLKSRTGLKYLMGSYYKPAWSSFEDYEQEDLYDKNFLMYCAIDGAATYLLYNNLLEQLNETV